MVNGAPTKRSGDSVYNNISTVQRAKNIVPKNLSNTTVSKWAYCSLG